MDTAALFQKLKEGDRAALGRAITLIESGRGTDREQARKLLRLCQQQNGQAQRIGITGIPGVGKSTLIDALGMQLIGKGHRVAVLAIDPSSVRSGGSILGDKTRMDRLSNEANAFIRPSPTGGTLGGVARRTRETILLCEAAGYDRILIETVGVGQSELEVDRLCDLNVLLMIAGAGDELQGIKRGIMESADLVVFTKADGDAKQRAEAAARDLRHALAMLPPRRKEEKVPILLTSATEGKGITELIDAIDRLFAVDEASGRSRARRQQQALYWFQQAIEEELLRRFNNDPAIQQLRLEKEEEIRSGKKSPYDAAIELIDRFLPDSKR